jgi:DNA polymerase V
LLAENPDFPAIILKEGEELCIWGVVTRVLHSV